ELCGHQWGELDGHDSWARQGARATPVPAMFKCVIWWIATIAMIACGGLAWLYAVSDNQISPILAVNVGASAPLILASLASAAPQIMPGKIG
ncbi:MAG: hypothetical protein ACXVE4_08265, partial [Solirubrobacteraceae bacterium]